MTYYHFIITMRETYTTLYFIVIVGEQVNTKIIFINFKFAHGSNDWMRILLFSVTLNV